MGAAWSTKGLWFVLDDRAMGEESISDGDVLRRAPRAEKGIIGTEFPHV